MRPIMNKKLLGTILKLERLKQNRGQKDISHGICVPSYLSKIENGEVMANEEVIKAIYDKLNIDYIHDDKLYNHLENLIGQYYDNLNYGVNNAHIFEELLNYQKLLEYSDLVIDWLIVKKYELNEECYINKFISNMNHKQKAYYHLLNYNNNELSLDDIKEYVNTIDNSMALILLCEYYFNHSNYSKIQQLENRIITKTIEEGNVYQLATYYQFKGASYAVFNMEDMMVDSYNRSINLFKNTIWKQRLKTVYYNLGATYISLSKYDLAKKYLIEAISDIDNNFMVLQKLALAYIRNNEIHQAKKYISKLKKIESISAYEELLIEELEFECEDDFLNDMQYLVLMEKIIFITRKQYHFGYLYFFKDQIISAYKAQRYYKKAMEFQAEISSNILNQQFK